MGSSLDTPAIRGSSRAPFRSVIDGRTSSYRGTRDGDSLWVYPALVRENRRSKSGSEQLVGAAEAIYLESVRLENFRCFEELVLNFNRPSSLDGRWTCIAGTTGSGKSTVLQALGLALLGSPLVLELGGERLNRMRRESNLRDQRRSKSTSC